MTYFELFDIYFLILNFIGGFLLIFIDGKRLNKAKDFGREKTAKILGYSLIIVSCILFVIRSLM